MITNYSQFTWRIHLANIKPIQQSVHVPYGYGLSICEYLRVCLTELALELTYLSLNSITGPY